MEAKSYRASSIATIGKDEPMTRGVKAYHGFQRIRSPAITSPGVKRLDDVPHVLPWQNLLHAGQENLFSGLKALTAEIPVGEGKVVPHDEPCSMAPDDKHELISGT
jgi:hypothetical protein